VAQFVQQGEACLRGYFGRGEDFDLQSFAEELKPQESNPTFFERDGKQVNCCTSPLGATRIGDEAS
jgi:hypothetical protein